MPLADFCKMPVVAVFPDETVEVAAKLMLDKKVGSVLVMEKDRPIGILTDRDIVTRMVAIGKYDSSTKVQEVMTKNLVSVPEGLGVWDLIQTMKTHGLRRFPVISGDGKLTGIITMDDIIELIGEEMSGLGKAVSYGVGRAKPLILQA